MVISDGMVSSEVDRIEAKDFVLGIAPLRPRNAATLILLDGMAAKLAFCLDVAMVA